jgi:hypothetical protein
VVSRLISKLPMLQKGTIFLGYKVPNFIVVNAIKRYKVPNNKVPTYMENDRKSVKNSD